MREAYHDPAITAYSVIEPRARTQDFTRSLRAEVRDPLWMLTRQWQMSEFEAEDAGSAIDARLLTTHAQVDRMELRNSPGHHYDLEIPMETMVEREQVPFTHALKVPVGWYFELHPPALRATCEPKYRAKVSFDPNQEDQFRGQVDGLSLCSQPGTAVDGEALARC